MSDIPKIGSKLEFEMLLEQRLHKTMAQLTQDELIEGLLDFWNEKAGEFQERETELETELEEKTDEFDTLETEMEELQEGLRGVKETAKQLVRELGDYLDG
jgi:chromosome segregation ATPase